jgi:hypothetical protein
MEQNETERNRLHCHGNVKLHHYHKHIGHTVQYHVGVFHF